MTKLKDIELAKSMNTPEEPGDQMGEFTPEYHQDQLEKIGYGTTPQTMEERYATTFKRSQFIEHSKITAFITSEIQRAKEEVLRDVLLKVQQDVDFGAKHQQIVSTKAQSYILENLTN